MQRLDSDVANADAQLHVEFYECKEEGMFKGKPFVRIMVPGDTTNIIDQPARDDHKRRFHRQWLYFQMEHSGAEVIGTPLLKWQSERPQEMTEGQLGELTILKFQSVEQVAQASDAQIKRIGMGGAGIRERARAYLMSKNAQASGAELKQAQDQIAALTAMVEKLAAATAAGAEKPKRKPRGRPFKRKVEADGQQHTAPAGTASL